PLSYTLSLHDALPILPVRRRHLECDPIRHAGFLRALARRLDGFLVVVGADKGGIGIRLGHDDSRGAVPAAYIRYSSAGLHLGLRSEEHTSELQSPCNL